jgi:hypothetical protein
MTNYRWIAIPAISVFVCILATQSSAQQGPPPPGVIRINVNLVQVDAVVTDNKGKAVTDLKAEDFEVLQDGKPQAITNFAFIDVKESTSRGFPPRPAAQPRGARATPLPPPPAFRPQQIRRTVALVVDDLGLSSDSIIRVRQSITKWVDTQMQPGDLVAVIRTSAGMGALQQFTADLRTGINNDFAVPLWALTEIKIHLDVQRDFNGSAISRTGPKTPLLDRGDRVLIELRIQ